MKRVWIWCKRFRYRKGYGVHSPFAFNLITWVIYEKLPYYAYRNLQEIRFSLRKNLSKTHRKLLNSKRIDRLLFRLVNYVQPLNIIEAGTSAGLTTLYLSEAQKRATVITIDDRDEVNRVARNLFSGRKNIIYKSVDSRPESKMKDKPEGKRDNKENIVSLLERELSKLQFIDFLYINCKKRTNKDVNAEKECEEIFEKCVPYATQKSLFVVSGIHSSPAMERWWKQVVEDLQVGITFDLYVLGLVFFDKSRIKQHYIINF